MSGVKTFFARVSIYSSSVWEINIHSMNSSKLILINNKIFLMAFRNVLCIEKRTSIVMACSYSKCFVYLSISYRCSGSFLNSFSLGFFYCYFYISFFKVNSLFAYVFSGYLILISILHSFLAIYTLRTGSESLHGELMYLLINSLWIYWLLVWPGASSGWGSGGVASCAKLSVFKSRVGLHRGLQSEGRGKEEKKGVHLWKVIRLLKAGRIA